MLAFEAPHSKCTCTLPSEGLVLLLTRDNCNCMARLCFVLLQSRERIMVLVLSL